jgi:uncharacterized repeat protein (TIGR03803 family)
VNTDGSGFTNLHNFAAGNGANPQAGLIISGNTLYGTTYYQSAYPGGGSGYGTVFAINTDGSGFTNLHSFTGGTDRGYPTGGLVLSGNTLYGTTLNGSVFAINTNGASFTNLYSFTPTYEYTNSDGANPGAGLILSSNTLYGTTENGGLGGYGTVFAIYTDGTGFTNLHNFTATTNFPYNVNGDGANPYTALVLSGNTLYGTAPGGGIYGKGTVFGVALGSSSTPPPFRITSIVQSGNNIVLTWTTPGGTTNQLQVTGGAAGGSYATNGFNNLGPQMIIGGNSAVTTNYTDTGGATNKPARYYRVRLVP